MKHDLGRLVPLSLGRRVICDLMDASLGIPLVPLPRYRRALRMAGYPRLVRRWVWWALLNISPRQRARHFGTFGVSSIGNWGAESMRPIGPNTSILHYGVVDAQGRVAVRL